MFFDSDFIRLYEELSEINEGLDLKAIIDKVAAEVEKYDENDSNQNCLLATWAVELQLRGEDFLPRPVYSPRDPIFDIKGEELIREPEVLKISSKEDVETQVLGAGNGARFYCHVNWAGSKGGHEFLVINDNNTVLVVDGQVGHIEDIQKDDTYFNDINFENSYIVRLDNKEINQDVLKLNDEDQIVEWDDEIDMKLLSEDINEKSISIDGVSSPEELMDWMNENITYELVDDEYSNSNGVPTKTAKEVLDTGTGHCAEQSYLEKEVLDGLGYETFLVMIKENNSKKEYGAEGSAHVFLVYKDGDNYCWFEHSMQHSRGIHKYTSLEALLQDVANQWWRYDKNSDILEVRMMDKIITGVDNWGLAKECYKLPVEYTFDISNNIMESDVPLEESVGSNSQIEYLPVSDIELFKEYADDILGGFGGMSDADIKSSIKEIKFEGKLAGYIGFSEYEENGHKCLGIGNL